MRQRSSCPTPFKAQVDPECLQPGATVSSVAISHGINATVKSCDGYFMQGDLDISSVYRVDHCVPLGYCERWCADGHSNCHAHPFHRVHVRHSHVHGA